MSVGIEATDELLEDMAQALDGVTRLGRASQQTA